MPHKTMRTVHLPESWDDLAANYRSYRDQRIIRSTDVFLGAELVYRSNALGCRGDDLREGRPTLLIVGDEFVHGDAKGSFVDQIRLEGVQVANGGVEELSFRSSVERILELAPLIQPIAVILVPPWRCSESAGVNGSSQAALIEALDRTANVPGLAFLAAPVLAGSPGADILRVVEVFAKDRNLPFLAPPPLEPRRPIRWLSSLKRTKPALPLEFPAAKMVEAYASRLRPLASTRAELPATTGRKTSASEAGPQSVGRNYPLW